MQYEDWKDDIMSDREDRKAKGREKDCNMIFKQ